MRHQKVVPLVVVSLVICLNISLLAQSKARDRVVTSVNDSQVTTLKGDVHPRARAEFDRGHARAAMTDEPHAAGVEAESGAAGELGQVVGGSNEPEVGAVIISGSRRSNLPISSERARTTTIRPLRGCSHTDSQ